MSTMSEKFGNGGYYFEDLHRQKTSSVTAETNDRPIAQALSHHLQQIVVHTRVLA